MSVSDAAREYLPSFLEDIFGLCGASGFHGAWGDSCISQHRETREWH